MAPLIDWIAERVEVAIEKHGLTRETQDAEKLTRFLAGRPRTYRETDPAQLQAQINGLADNLARVVKERDKLQSRLEIAHRKIDNLNLKFWIVSCIVLGQSGVIGFLATELFSRLK